ncbi:putative plant self-incompatibility S1 [Helianthus annuus]|nr:putative plant self-incompatibility S1 [Helianthus annuus]
MDSKNFLFLLVLTSYYVYFVTASFETYNMEVIDGKIEHLTFHISSKDTDFGNKTMTTNGTFRWSFRRNIGETTSFRGEFFWMNADGTPLQEVDFTIFNNDVAAECGQDIRVDHNCFWLVTDTGFYFSKDTPGNWVFKYKWPLNG